MSQAKTDMSTEEASTSDLSIRIKSVIGQVHRKQQFEKDLVQPSLPVITRKSPTESEIEKSVFDKYGTVKRSVLLAGLKERHKSVSFVPHQGAQIKRL